MSWSKANHENEQLEVDLSKDAKSEITSGDLYLLNDAHALHMDPMSSNVMNGRTNVIPKPPDVFVTSPNQKLSLNAVSESVKPNTATVANPYGLNKTGVPMTVTAVRKTPVVAQVQKPVVNNKRIFEEEDDDEEDDDEEEGEEESYSEEEDEESGSGSTSSTSSSSSDDDEEKDSAKRYPLFTSQYATYCNYGIVPFLREETVRHAPSSDAGSSTSRIMAVAGTPKVQQQFILYGEYTYEATLGKGTYSKVVLATPLRAIQASSTARGSSTAPSSSSASSPHGGDGTVATSGNGRLITGPEVRVALKIFRNKETYREACWDEMVILSLLCGLPPVPAMAPGRGPAVGGGLAEYTASLARFIAPISYIPHPMHPALVLPLLGSSTLRVCRKVKLASREVAAAEGYDIRQSPNNKPAVWYRGLPLQLLKSVIYQILIFLQYSHAKGIVHTDLKPENVLFESVHGKPVVVPVFYREIRRGGEDEENAEENEESQKIEKEKSDGSQETSQERKEGNRKTSAPESDEAPQKKARKNSNEESSLHSTMGTVDPTSKMAEGSNLDPNFPFLSFMDGKNGTVVRFAHKVTVDFPHLPSIRVVDLGAAQLLSSFTHISRIDRQTPVSYDRIQTKHYISPEVLLCTGWSASADMFSLGCMIPELLTGDCLFMPQHRVEHLALMEHIIGPFSREDTKQYRRGRRFIDDAFVCNPQNAEIDFDGKSKVLRWPLTENILAQRGALVAQYERGYNSEVNSDNDDVDVSTEEDIRFVKDKATLEEILGPIPQLLDLTKKLLIYHPLERITPAEALRHPFFHTM